MTVPDQPDLPDLRARVEAELHHAEDNGHRLDSHCQGVGPGQIIPAVRIDFIRGALAARPSAGVRPTPDAEAVGLAEPKDAWRAAGQLRYRYKDQGWPLCDTCDHAARVGPGDVVLHVTPEHRDGVPRDLDLSGHEPTIDHWRAANR